MENLQIGYGLVAANTKRQARRLLKEKENLGVISNVKITYGPLDLDDPKICLRDVLLYQSNMMFEEDCSSLSYYIKEEAKEGKKFFMFSATYYKAFF